MRIIIMVHLYHKKLSSFHETLSLRAGGLLLLLVTGEGRSGEGREAMATRILFTVAAGPITPYTHTHTHTHRGSQQRDV